MGEQEPVGWIDQRGNLFPLDWYNPAAASRHDAHKRTWRRVAVIEEGAPPDDMPMCLTCMGSGEGQNDGATCRACRGSGVER